MSVNARALEDCEICSLGIGRIRVMACILPSVFGCIDYASVSPGKGGVRNLKLSRVETYIPRKS